MNQMVTTNQKLVVDTQKIKRIEGLGQSVEHVTLDLGVMSLSPMLGIEFTLKK